MVPASPRGTGAYTGRFAPSPTGPLHFGSLVAALASWLDARAHGGQWLLRMEDLDPPRNSAAHAAGIPRALEYFGLDWDGAILYQSARTGAYEEALQRLVDAGLVYPCTCSRATTGNVYDGRCRTRPMVPLPASPHALRVRVTAEPIAFVDRLRGPQSSRLSEEVGDFVLKRKEGYFAYQLAVVVDDAFQGVSHVVRGNDLLDSTCRQIYLQHLLDVPVPAYAHIPLIVDARGDKLSKQTFATPLELRDASRYLAAALCALGFPPPPALVGATARELLAWGIEAWNPQRVTAEATIPEAGIAYLAEP